MTEVINLRRRRDQKVPARDLTIAKARWAASNRHRGSWDDPPERGGPTEEERRAYLRRAALPTLNEELGQF